MKPLSTIGAVPFVADHQRMTEAVGFSFDANTGSLSVPLVNGASPWTYVRLASDFLTSSTSAVNVSNLGFTPAALKNYDIEGIFLVRTATAIVGPRPGVSWPSGCSDGVASIQQTSSVSAFVIALGNIAASLLSPTGGLPDTTNSYPAILRAIMVTGGSPSGNFQVQLASSTALTSVTMKAGSYIRWRTY